MAIVATLTCGVSLLLLVALAIDRGSFSKRAFAYKLKKLGIRSVVVYTYPSNFPAQLVGTIVMPRYWLYQKGYTVREAVNILDEDCRTQVIADLRGESAPRAITKVEGALLVVLYNLPE